MFWLVIGLEKWFRKLNVERVCVELMLLMMGVIYIEFFENYSIDYF